MSTTPIADYALLSDRHSAALVSRDGSIDWLCFPRFDSPSIFGRLLGDEAGHWSIRATERHRGDPPLPGPHHGVGDHLPHADGYGHHHRRPGHGRRQPGARARQGCAAPPAAAGDVRRRRGRVVRGVRPASRVRAGPSPARCCRRWSGRVRGRRRAGPLFPGGPDRRPSRRPRASSSSAAARARASPSITRKRAETGTAKVWSQSEIGARLDDTVSAWESWSELHQAYVGPWRDLVHHSGRVLQSLSFAPTGAICAAATTSLPEVVGGARNWDYRYAWVRDASFTIEALWVAACPDEANQFFDYVTVVRGRLARPGRRPADHVRHRRRTGPDRAGAAAPGGLATLRPRSGRQRRLEPAPARRLRRIAQRRVPPLGPPLRRRLPTGRADGRPGQVGCAPRSGTSHPTVLRPTGRHRRPALAGEGPGDLGGSGRAPRLLVLQADVLGGPRPGGGPGRPSRRLRPGRGMEADPGPDP